MRALVNDGATASRQEPPCTTPEELVKAVAAMPRIRPPEPAFTAPPDVPAHDVPAGHVRPPAAASRRASPSRVPAPPPPLQSRTGKALKWAVSALLIAALGLGSWQLADTLLDRSRASPTTRNQPDDGRTTTRHRRGQPASRSRSRAPRSTTPGRQRRRTPTRTKLHATTATASTYWRTTSYIDGPTLGRPQARRRHHLRPRLGQQEIVGASLSLRYGGTITASLAVRRRTRSSASAASSTAHARSSPTGHSGTTLTLKARASR